MSITDAEGKVVNVHPGTQTRERVAERPRSAAVNLAELFDSHAAFLVRVVARMLGSRDRAEDVVQRVFLTAHRKGLPEGDADRARAWLYRVAMNEVRHDRRALARRLRLSAAFGLEPDVPIAPPDERVSQKQRAEAVHELVAELPPTQREVFVLYELEEMSGSEIAQIVGIPENTVWSRLRLARKRFEGAWQRREESA